MEKFDAAPACDPTVFDEARRHRHDDLQRRFAAVVEESRELPDGCAFRLVPDASVFVAVAEWITLDRLCCPFMDFRLEWRGGEAWLSLTGDDRVKTMLVSALGAAR